MNRLRGARWEPLECGLPITGANDTRKARESLGLFRYAYGELAAANPGGWPSEGALKPGQPEAATNGTSHAHA